MRGTASHVGQPVLPERVQLAVELARSMDFPLSCRIEQGRLLTALASGARTRIGETGTGCGVGLAWLLEGRRDGVEVVSVEREPSRHKGVAELFGSEPGVTLLGDDWRAIEERGPFDLLVLDGGGNGKTEPPIDPTSALTPGGTIVVDDFTPCDVWPPVHEGEPDEVRMWWLEHPRLQAAELRLAPDLSTIVATLRP
jgi:predicted O-methyltransferase YrrM